jgi:YbbR domain-containing protein
VSMGADNPAVRLQQPRPARVTITVVPSPVVHFAGRPVLFRNVAPGRRVSAEPAAVTVTVRGAHDALARLTEGDIEPYIDLIGVAPGRYVLQVRVDPRPPYEIVTIEPATVAVTIK